MTNPPFPAKGDRLESTLLLIDLLGAAALLIWGLRLIKTGVLRAYGASIRQWIAKGTGNRVTAALSGFCATLGLQSSTATAVITASFAARDIIDPRMAQAVMLGANLGTAVVAVVLSYDLHWLSSLLIFGGVALFSTSGTSKGKSMGRAVLGLGLMLLALHLLGGVTEPMRDAPTVITVLAALEDAPMFALILAAALAVLGSSSLAVVVLVMLLAQTGIVGPGLALCLVAGANVGGAVPPYLAVAGEGIAARRLTLANLLVRLAGGLVVVAASAPLAVLFAALLHDPAQQVAIAHVAFNVMLLVIFLPLISPVGRLANRLLPARPADARLRPAYLDDQLLQTPGMALAVAARETLRLGDLVGDMLDKTLQALQTPDEAPLQDVNRLEDEVDLLTEAVKLYVARLGQTELDAEEMRRSADVISYAVNLEHIGDIIEGGLADIAARKTRRRLSLSPEGLCEIEEFFLQTRENLRLAQAIFLSRDAVLARQLMDQKVVARRLEAQSSERHMARVREGRADTLETSALHLDLLRDLKRVNAHLASVAYPILEDLGALRESRVRKMASS